MRILYVEDDPLDADLTRRQLCKSTPHFDLELAGTQREALARLSGSNASRYDLVLTDIRLQDGDGLAILSHIRARNLPLAVVLITGAGDEETAVAVLKAGANDYVVKRGNYLSRLPLTLEDALHHYRAEVVRHARPLRVLYAEHNAADIDLLRRHLGVHASHIHMDIVGTAAEALQRLPESGQVREYDILLLDYRLPGSNALEILKELYQMRRLDIPVVLVTGQGDEEVALQALKLGAAEYVPKNSGYLHQLPSILESTFHRSQLARDQAALRESESKYRTLVENIPLRIFTKDTESFYVSCNENFAKDLGIKPDGLAGKTDFDFFPKKLADKYREDDKRVMETGKTEDLEQEYIRDGKKAWIQTIKTPIRQEDGSVTGILGASWDITERKRSEEERKKLQAQLLQAQKLEAVGRLAGGVAHDFNNMLGVILGHTDLALDQLDQNDLIFTHVEEIRKASARSADLIRQLLAFARKQTIAPRVLDLNETVEGMLKMLKRLIGEDINLVWLPGKALWPVKVDPSQIDQILANLCVNSRDAIAGVGKVTIETNNMIVDKNHRPDHPEMIPGEYVMLTVSDDGCGMSQETLVHLFEPFYTTKGVGEGTGLGLATIYGIVTQNKGFIYVDSKQGGGASFKIFLPRHAKKAVSRNDGAQTPPAHGCETILLVEDEPAVLKMSKLMLEKYGYKILVASKPSEAVRVAEKHAGEIHLLLTDVVMPDMSGKDLAKKLTSLYPGLKCLFTSGYAGDAIARYGVLDEGVNFIQKPFSKHSLAAKVREALDMENGGVSNLE